VLITAVSARTLVSRTTRSLQSSMNGFPISSITLYADSLYLVEKLLPMRFLSANDVEDQVHLLVSLSMPGTLQSLVQTPFYVRL